MITEDRVPRVYDLKALFSNNLEQLMMLSPILSRLKFALLVMGSMIAKRVAQDHGVPYPPYKQKPSLHVHDASSPSATSKTPPSR